MTVIFKGGMKFPRKRPGIDRKIEALAKAMPHLGIPTNPPAAPPTPAEIAAAARVNVRYQLRRFKSAHRWE